MGCHGKLGGERDMVSVGLMQSQNGQNYRRLRGFMYARMIRRISC
jgi:hypothetical protein